MTEPAHLRYLERVRDTLDCIERTQAGPIAEAADRCADAILRDGLVHLFGSGHSRMAVEEMYPRYGSFPGFHPIVELPNRSGDGPQILVDLVKDVALGRRRQLRRYRHAPHRSQLGPVLLGGALMSWVGMPPPVA